MEQAQPRTRRAKRLYGAYLKNFGTSGGWIRGEALVDISHCAAALLRRHRHQSSLVIRPVARIPGTDKWKAYPDD